MENISATFNHKKSIKQDVKLIKQTNQLNLSKKIVSLIEKKKSFKGKKNMQENIEYSEIKKLNENNNERREQEKIELNKYWKLQVR